MYSRVATVIPLVVVCAQLESLDLSFCGSAVNDDMLRLLAEGLPKLRKLSVRYALISWHDDRAAARKKLKPGLFPESRVGCMLSQRLRFGERSRPGAPRQQHTTAVHAKRVVLVRSEYGGGRPRRRRTDAGHQRLSPAPHGLAAATSRRMRCGRRSRPPGRYSAATRRWRTSRVSGRFRAVPQGATRWWWPSAIRTHVFVPYAMDGAASRGRATCTGKSAFCKIELIQRKSTRYGVVYNQKSQGVAVFDAAGRCAAGDAAPWANGLVAGRAGADWPPARGQPAAKGAPAVVGDGA